MWDDAAAQEASAAAAPPPPAAVPLQSYTSGLAPPSGLAPIGSGYLPSQLLQPGGNPSNLSLSQQQAPGAAMHGSGDASAAAQVLTADSSSDY